MFNVQLTQEQFDKLSIKLSDHLEGVFKEEFKQLREGQKSILGTITSYGNTVNDDHKDLSHMRTDIAGALQALKEIISLFASNATTLNKGIKESAEAAIEKVTTKAAEQIEPALTAAVEKVNTSQPLIQSKKPWWRVLFHSKST